MSESPKQDSDATDSSAQARSAFDPKTFDPSAQIATELALPHAGVCAVLRLLGEGGTVPFIARYRKEATGALDEVQIRAIEERCDYLKELEDRRSTVLSTIAEQGKLTPELEASIRACTTKTALEDIYLPYKPKRRTRAMIARERGLEPLAERILAQPTEGSPVAEAAGFINAELEVPDAEAALAGARDIVAEKIAEDAATRDALRNFFAQEGEVIAEAAKKDATERTKFEQYYDFHEKVKSIPSHRYLAMRRGERERVLKVRVDAPSEAQRQAVERRMHLDERSPFAEQLRLAISDSFSRLLEPAMENDIRTDLKLRSDRSAVDVFAENLKNLLLAAPLGSRSVIGIDPGQRTGCKCAVVDSTGRFLEHTTIYLSSGDNKLQQAETALLKLVDTHQPFALAVGNGTGGRETEAFCRRVLQSARPEAKVTVVQVNEAGASVYSASDIAREEFSELDLTIRGAISIARRLQDPLAELVKIEPKAIGVGQYQHDVHQPLLAKKLDEVIESCVNAVGVELNTASAPLLSRVAGLGPSLAKNIVKHRDEHGKFPSRKALLKVAKLGPRTYEQCAGFLRVRGGEHPLDASAVHPERYSLVERIAKDLQVGLAELVGNAELAGRIDTARYIGEGVGEPTLRDIIEELKKPGRDPRASFEPPKFRDGIEKLEDLEVGMRLEGVVTNVTHFGAFVDVGVHQDGLVHISRLADRFVSDPHEVVKVGDKIQVSVVELDLERRRIGLSARREEAPRGPNEAGGSAPNEPRGGARRQDHGRGERPTKAPERFSNNPFARLLGKDRG